MSDNEIKLDDKVFDKVNQVDLKNTMENYYIDYAMSVIVARALPDVRDGLKPVQRRILHAMAELNNGPDKPHRKCARIVGDTMGKYHPHGDSSIYGALVNMAQDWSMRKVLVDGHGNFGSVDGDGAAAMRYTEARLSKISMEMLADINKDTVDFVPNFDETESEPTVLPARFPNLLVNGTTGIAVGMATNIPPHNLNEVIDAVIKLIDDKVNGVETTIEDLIGIVQGPDFPTGAVILGHSGVRKAYMTGKGKVIVRAVSTIEPMPNGKNRIVVTELPYLVNKAKLQEKIAELVKDKKIDGITDIRDESDRHGMRLCIECRKDVNVNVLLNQLYKHTQLQDTFGIIMLALVNNVPQVLNLKDMLVYYLKHQEEVVTRRTKFDLNKAKERAHILEGLLKALDYIDEVIRIIRGSSSVAEAKNTLIEKLGLDDVQAQAIVDMRLRALTSLESKKLQDEFDDLTQKIQYYNEILSDEFKLLGVIKEEISVIKDKYGDGRRTAFEELDSDFDDEDLIPEETTIVARTSKGYIKRMSPDNFKLQRRGGKGIKGMNTIDDDVICDLLLTTTHSHILFFTNLGRVYRLKGYIIPEASRISRGIPVINMLKLQPEEYVTNMVTTKDYDDSRNLLMITKNGIFKKIGIEAFKNVNKNGVRAISFAESDSLVNVIIAEPNKDVLVMTKNGRILRFKEENIRALGRTARGVRGIKLKENDEIVGLESIEKDSVILSVSELGYGKLTDPDEFTSHNRGGQGVIGYKVTEKTGKIVSIKIVDKDDELLLITNEGIVIRIPVEGIRQSGRAASGVKLINVSKGGEIGDVRVASVIKLKAINDEEIAALEDEIDKEEDIEGLIKAEIGTTEEE